MELQTIHSDDRGSVNLLLGDLKTLKEVTVFVTKAGFTRGGCIHPNSDEWCCVIEGEISYVIGDHVCTAKGGCGAFIPKNTPHYFTSITDSVVLEWGADPEEKKNKHKEFRKIVDDLNSKKVASDML